MVNYTPRWGESYVEIKRKNLFWEPDFSRGCGAGCVRGRCCCLAMGVGRMKRLLMILLLLSPPAFAQDDGVDPYAECAELLNSPPLDTLLTQNDGNGYGLLPSDHLGASLLGVKCSRDQIVEYFLSAGWEFRGESKGYSINGPPSDRFEMDYSIAFCKPRNFPWRLIFYRCEAIAGFHFFEGRVTHINAGLNL